jgi:hypothetical protein
MLASLLTAASSPPKLLQKHKENSRLFFKSQLLQAQSIEVLS